MSNQLSEGGIVMDQKTKRAWMDALRSGGYKQTKSVLYNPQEDAYCCLGVLCRVADLPIYVNKNDVGNTVLNAAGEEEDYQPLAKLVGRNLQPLFSRNDELVDGRHKHTFPEIADFIEGYVHVKEI
jgi:hypothetical protein